MPELPEVETTRRGILPHVAGRSVQRVDVHQRQLRWPVPRRLEQDLAGTRIDTVERRAKYLLFRTHRGTMILHLGMSGSLRVLPRWTPAEEHEHVDVLLDSGRCLRLRDPRRFGSVLWTRRDPARHALLSSLGPEPLGPDFDADYLRAQARGRKVAIKNLIMNSHVVVGVGNIYASEALFRAGIHPARAAGRIAGHRFEGLVAAIQEVLQASIRAGGTTLRDFLVATGEPGYFKTELLVYDREGEPCRRCGQPLRHAVTGQRSTFYCKTCQR